MNNSLFSRTSSLKIALLLSLAIAQSFQIQFVIEPGKETCIFESVPKNEAVAAEVSLWHSPTWSGFTVELSYQSETGDILDKIVMKDEYKASKVYIHDVDGPVLFCMKSDAKRRIRAKVQVNLMLPDVSELPTKKEGDELNRALFTTNSRLMELINDHKSFEEEEQKAQAANMRTESSLRYLLLVEVVVCIVLGVVQYILLRNFIKGFSPFQDCYLGHSHSTQR